MVLVLFIGIIYATNQIILIQNKANPNIITENILDSDPQELLLNNQNFPIAFGLNWGNTLWKMDPRIMSFSVKYKYVKRSADYSSSQTLIDDDLQTVPCSQSAFASYPREFSVLHLSNYYCINYTKHPDGVNLKGQFISEIFSYIMIRFMKCVNSTLNPSCAPPEEISAYLNSMRAEFVYQHSLLNPRDYNSPRQSFLDSTYYYP